MQLAIFGNTSEAEFAPEWTDETAVAILAAPISTSHASHR